MSGNGFWICVSSCAKHHLVRHFLYPVPVLHGLAQPRLCLHAISEWLGISMKSFVHKPCCLKKSGPRSFLFCIHDPYFKFGLSFLHYTVRIAGYCCGKPLHISDKRFFNLKQYRSTFSSWLTCKHIHLNRSSFVFASGVAHWSTEVLHVASGIQIR